MITPLTKNNRNHHICQSIRVRNAKSLKKWNVIEILKMHTYIELEKNLFYNKRKGMYPSLPEKSPTYKIII